MLPKSDFFDVEPSREWKRFVPRWFEFPALGRVFITDKPPCLPSAHRLMTACHPVGAAVTPSAA